MCARTVVVLIAPLDLERLCEAQAVKDKARVSPRRLPSAPRAGSVQVLPQMIRQRRIKLTVVPKILGARRERLSVPASGDHCGTRDANAGLSEVASPG